MHLAAESHVDRSIDGPAAFIQTNVVGTFILLEEARRYFAALSPARRNSFRLHHISTDEVFGTLGANDAPFDETTRYDPRSPYSASKAASDLQALFKAYILFSLVVVTIGPLAAPILLSLVAGPRWTSSGAGACLAAYAWYVPLLAINGVAEAFVASVASESELHRQSAFMTVFSLAFAAAGFVSLRVMDLGAVGLVLANVVNMLCRILWCTVYISRYFSRAAASFDLAGLLPSPVLILAAAITSQAISRLARPSISATSGSVAELILQLAKIAATSAPFVAFL